MPRNPGADVLRYFAGRLDVDAHARRRRGDAAGADQAAALADEMRAEAARLELTPVESSGNLHAVTDEQLERRGRAIAKGKSAGTKDRLWKAIVASKWGSQERYAPERLGVSPPSLSNYRSGVSPCPRKVADKVKADFGIGYDYWPRGVVD